MIQGKNFIFTGLQSWDITIGSNAKDIALEISKHNRVLYINTPLDIRNYQRENKPEVLYRKQVIKKQAPPIRRINNNLWIVDFPFPIYPINFLPDGMLFDLINRLNNKRMYSYIKEVILKLKFDSNILFIDNDIYRSFYAKEYLAPELSIYYRRDNLQPFPFWKKHAYRLEPLLIKKSDIVVCNSVELSEFAHQYNNQTFDIGQGVDLSRYNIEKELPIPNDIKDIKRPIIGYLGDITSLRLDPELIFELAKNNPNYSYVLVGGYDTIFASHALKDLPNIHFLGPKPPTEVPEYIHSFDICMNPQKLNEITIGNYPRKIDEFLAMGKPVIATATQTMNLFKEHCFCCKNINDYEDAIHTILTGMDKSKKQEKIDFAHTHSWENSVARLYSLIERITKKNK